MDNKNFEVGQRIFETRKNKKYTREQLSELAEISVQFLSDIEKGKKTMTVTTLRRVATALNVTTDYIVNGTKEIDNSNIYAILNSLPEKRRKQAEKILLVFVESLDNNL